MLREELIEDEKESSEGTWSHIRDAIQTKVPFVIITFKSKEDSDDAISDDLKEYNITKQMNILHRDGKTVKFPSVFFVLNDDSDFRNEVKDLYEKYDIYQIVVGKNNTDSALVYFEDGESNTFGNEVVNTLDPSEFASEDRYKVGSVFYRFIGMYT